MDEWDMFMSLQSDEFKDAQSLVAQMLYSWFESFRDAGFSEHQALFMAINYYYIMSKEERE